MTQISGYIITPRGEDALALFGSEGVRYAASLDDGRGFVAFTAERPRAFELGTYGRVLSEVDMPIEWQADEFLKRIGGKPEGPKRQLARGDERFVLYDVLDQGTSAWKALELFLGDMPRAAAVVFDGATAFFYILVETGPEWDCPIPAVWDCTVVAFRDARLESVG